MLYKGDTLPAYVVPLYVRKQRLIRKMSNSSDLIVQTLARVVLYHDVFPSKVNGWKHTCARVLTRYGMYNRHDLRLNRNDYLYNLFGSFPSDELDAKPDLDEIELELELSGSYPEYKYDYVADLSSVYYKVCVYVLYRCMYTYLSNNSDRGYNYYRSIVDKAFEQVGL